MMDLTPLDVRKKAGDFRRVMRGFDPEEVGGFLQIVAERFEELVRENLTLRQRAESMQERLSGHEGRESAVQEALVMAQQLREDVRLQAKREAELVKKEAKAERNRLVGEAEQQVAEARRALSDLEERRVHFLRSFRTFLREELAAVEGETSRPQGGLGTPELPV
jgi:DivIVA domain-containing protein